MKKLKFFAMCAVLIGAFTAIALTSCTKEEDVNYDDNATVNHFPDEKYGADGLAWPCPICGNEIPHGSYCRHNYAADETCPFGDNCIHSANHHRHHHIFWNMYSGDLVHGGVHFELTTHSGSASSYNN